MKNDEQKWVKARIFFIAAVFIFLFGTMAARGYQLQLLSGEKLGARAVKQYIEKIALPPVRGKILDRNGETLASNREVSSIFAQPPAISNPAQLAANLKEIIGGDREKIRKKQNHSLLCMHFGF